MIRGGRDADARDRPGRAEDGPSRRNALLYDHRPCRGRSDGSTTRPRWRHRPRLGRPRRSSTRRRSACSAWYSAWWEGYGGERELRVCTVWDGGRAGRRCCRSVPARRPPRGDGQRGELRRAPARARRRRAAAARGGGRCASATTCSRSGACPRATPPSTRSRGAARAARRMQPRGAGHHLTDRRHDAARSSEYRRRPSRSGTRTCGGCTASCCAITTRELRLIEPPSDLERRADRGLRGGVERLEARGGLGDPLPARERGPSTAASRGASTSAASCASRRSRIDGRMIAWDLGILHRNRLYSPKSGYLRGVQAAGPGPGAGAGDDRALLRARASRHTSCSAPTRTTSCASPRASAATGCSAPTRGGPRPRCATRGGATRRARCARRAHGGVGPPSDAGTRARRGRRVVRAAGPE